MSIQPPTAEIIADRIAASVETLVKANVTGNDMGLSRRLAEKRLYDGILSRLLRLQPDAYLNELVTEYQKVAASIAPLSRDDTEEQAAALQGFFDDYLVWLRRQMHTDAGIAE